MSISIDKEKLNKDAKWDGLKGYITNTTLRFITFDHRSNIYKIFP